MPEISFSPSPAPVAPGSGISGGGSFSGGGGPGGGTGGGTGSSPSEIFIQGSAFVIIPISDDSVAAPAFIRTNPGRI